MADKEQSVKVRNGAADDLFLKALIFKLADQFYALPVLQVREIVRAQSIRPLPQAPSFIEGVIRLRDRILPVTDLRKRFGLPASGGAESKILIARLPKALVGLVVDGAVGVFTLPRGSIQKPSELISHAVGERFISGIAEIEGRLTVFLDLEAVFLPEEHRHLAGLIKPEAGTQESKDATGPNHD